MATDPEVSEFGNIFLSGKAMLHAGKLKFAPGGVGWKDAVTGKVTTLAADAMRKAQWMRGVKDHQLRLIASNGSVLRLDGFSAEAMTDIKRILKDFYGLDLDVKELCVRGWNWGQTEFQGNSLLFSIGNKPALEIPLSEVSNTAMTAKTEINLEFKPPSAEELAGKKKGDQLVEMRFYVPGKSLKAVDDSGNVDVDGEEVTKETTEEEISAATQFHDTIKLKADLGTIAGDSIVPFHELPFLIPRGRYEVDMFDDFIRMHGKSYDYKIPFKNVKSLFLLPKPDDVHVMFVIGLDPAIRQGQTRYPFLVLQFPKDEDLEVTLNMEEDALNEKFDGRLKKQYDGPTGEVVSTIFKEMTSVPLKTESSFRSHFNLPSIKCTVKANEGYLFPLGDCLLFLPKALHIPFSEITAATFSRVGGALAGPAGSSRTFDLNVSIRNSSDVAFSNIAKEEQEYIAAYLKRHSIKIKSDMNEDAFMAMETEDETGSETDHSRKKQKTADGSEDEDSSEDEDFVAEDSSDVAEEFDENHESSGSESGSDVESGGDEEGDDD